jgi:hypothetical protein
MEEDPENNKVQRPRLARRRKKVMEEEAKSKEVQREVFFSEWTGGARAERAAEAATKEPRRLIAGAPEDAAT